MGALGHLRSLRKRGHCSFSCVLKSELCTANGVSSGTVAFPFLTCLMRSLISSVIGWVSSIERSVYIYFISSVLSSASLIKSFYTGTFSPKNIRVWFSFLVTDGSLWSATIPYKLSFVLYSLFIIPPLPDLYVVAAGSSI